MKRISCFLLLISIIGLSGCTVASGVREIDAQKFLRFFASQRVCMEYIDGLVTPAIEALSSMETPEQMRVWIHENPDY